MRQSVIVNGITLTAEQVQEAYKKLQEPEVSSLKPGDIVRVATGVRLSNHSGCNLLVLGPDIGWLSGVKFPYAIPSGYCRVTDGRTTWCSPQAWFVKIGVL